MSDRPTVTIIDAVVSRDRANLAPSFRETAGDEY